jgi:5-formyltetrahydrofolate cyclo-ligase
MTKVQLRQQFLLQRTHLTFEQLQIKSQEITQTFFNQFDLTNVNTLHSFLPLRKHNEINTWLIINRIFQNYPHLTILTSKVEWQTRQMSTHLLTPQTQLQENSWGISEPLHTVAQSPDIIEMILLPLIGFDKQGFRVGYGKGFYDRFLPRCRQSVIKIGLSLFEPIDKIEDIDEYDVPMDYCVMSERVFHWR